MSDNFDIKDYTLIAAKTIWAKNLSGVYIPGHVIIDETGAQIFGSAADAKSSATDTTAAGLTAISKEMSFCLQAISSIIGSLGFTGGNLNVNMAALTAANPNGRASGSASAPTVMCNEDLASLNKLISNNYKAFGSGVTGTCGATGSVGDYLTSVTIVPATTSPGAVSVADANGSSITIFVGGASSVSNLCPFTVGVTAKCTGATTPGWHVTCGANVSAIASGNFT